VQYVFLSPASPPPERVQLRLQVRPPPRQRRRVPRRVRRLLLPLLPRRRPPAAAVSAGGGAGAAGGSVPWRGAARLLVNAEVVALGHLVLAALRALGLHDAEVADLGGVDLRPQGWEEERGGGRQGFEQALSRHASAH
jgi:hypothetical protein